MLIFLLNIGCIHMNRIVQIHTKLQPHKSYVSSLDQVDFSPHGKNPSHPCHALRLFFQHTLMQFIAVLSFGKLMSNLHEFIQSHSYIFFVQSAYIPLQFG